MRGQLIPITQLVLGPYSLASDLLAGAKRLGRASVDKKEDWSATVLVKNGAGLLLSQSGKQDETFHRVGVLYIKATDVLDLIGDWKVTTILIL